jgi:small-conductance mechanosensitive channel
MLPMPYARGCAVVSVALLLVSLGLAAPAWGQALPAAGLPPTTQEPPPGQEPLPQPQEAPPAVEQFGGSIMQFVEALPESEAATFTFHNREITTLRARVLGRTPEERASSGVQRLNDLIARGGDHTLDLAPFETAILVQMDGESVIAIVPQDLDALSGETVSSKAEEALARLQVAVNEAVELRNPQLLLLGAARAAVSTAIFLLIAYLLVRLRHRIEKPLMDAASERLSETGIAGRFLTTEMRLERVARRLVMVLLGVVTLAACYLWLTFVLRQFPYTRPWGEALGDRLLATLAWVASGILTAMPGLFTVAIVVVVTRIVSRLVRAFFDAVQQGRIHVLGLEPDVARPTRQIVTVVLWIFALVVSYPYLPGSNTDAFRGVSVFVGLVLSIGSTGVVSQAMNGLILMYSGALRAGEYVKVGDVEGTVMHLGMLSTRIHTLTREMVTIPNSVMVAKETTNYSRLSNEAGVAINTTLTLGYDIPWRQVQAILELAAQRTEGIRKAPEPFVLQTALSDFYVAYKLIAFVEDPRSRPRILSELHTHILDLCNEHGIQILSPHYESDPKHPAIVPPERWNLPPAESRQPADPDSVASE